MLLAPNKRIFSLQIVLCTSFFYGVSFDVGFLQRRLGPSWSCMAVCPFSWSCSHPGRNEDAVSSFDWQTIEITGHSIVGFSSELYARRALWEKPEAELVSWKMAPFCNSWLDHLAGDHSRDTVVSLVARPHFDKDFLVMHAFCLLFTPKPHARILKTNFGLTVPLASLSNVALGCISFSAFSYNSDNSA